MAEAMRATSSSGSERITMFGERHFYPPADNDSPIAPGRRSCFSCLPGKSRWRKAQKQPVVASDEDVRIDPVVVVDPKVYHTDMVQDQHSSVIGTAGVRSGAQKASSSKETVGSTCYSSCEGETTDVPATSSSEEMLHEPPPAAAVEVRQRSPARQPDAKPHVDERRGVERSSSSRSDDRKSTGKSERSTSKVKLEPREKSSGPIRSLKEVHSSLKHPIKDPPSAVVKNMLNRAAQRKLEGQHVLVSPRGSHREYRLVHKDVADRERRNNRRSSHK